MSDLSTQNDSSNEWLAKGKSRLNDIIETCVICGENFGQGKLEKHMMDEHIDEDNANKDDKDFDTKIVMEIKAMQETCDICGKCTKCRTL